MRTPPHILGRVMSLIMTAATGLAPISMAVAGALIVFDVRMVLIVSGCLFALTALLALTSRSLRMMDVIEGDQL